ncbi:MAG TPA: aldo/keto reductase [Gaiellaceae bacterium]|nr:aldo/keto reductase [Gaiellaceae bacterium]
MWLASSDLRIGLGCMRLPEDTAHDTIAAAVEAGITVFDTARSYDGNERLVANALRGANGVRIVTKGGMRREGGAWIPDGRARTIRADCQASLAALDGLPIDLYLIHAPDPRTPWSTAVRALARLADEGLVRHVGVSNVNRGRLDEALELAPIAAVEVALSVFDDTAVRGGVLERCEDAGIAVLAHSPLGGPRRAGRLDRRPDLVETAEAHSVTPAEVALARLLALSPVVVPIPGARRPEAARSAARAAALHLDEPERARPATPARRKAAGEVVLVMGIPGAGKTRSAEDYAAGGYLRLNRDERGGTLRELAGALDDELSSGTPRVVLDNTYLSRASRSYVIEAANRHGVAVRCVWLDTPLAQAQVNVVERLLERFGRLPTPEELKAAARREAGVHAPTSQMRAVRELEPPSTDEGFARVERAPFERAPREGRAGVFVAASALSGWRGEADGPRLVFEWRPGADTDDAGICPHPGGPPICWCRPPLPGLPLAFAREHGVDPGRSVLVGTSAAHRTLATTLGARYVSVG